MHKKTLLNFIVVIILTIYTTTCFTQNSKIYSGTVIKCDSLKYYYYAGDGIYFDFTNLNRNFKYRKYDLTTIMPQKIIKKLSRINDTLKQKLDSKFKDINMLYFVECINSKRDSTKYQLKCSFPTVDEMSIIFTLQFDNNYKLLNDFKFINSLKTENFFSKLNPCKAIKIAFENETFKTFYENFHERVKSINLNYDIGKNIWVYKIIGITLDEKGKDGWTRTSECCYGKTLIMNAITYDIIEVIDHFYGINKSPL